MMATSVSDAVATLRTYVGGKGLPEYEAAWSALDTLECELAELRNARAVADHAHGVVCMAKEAALERELAEKTARVEELEAQLAPAVRPAIPFLLDKAAMERARIYAAQLPDDEWPLSELAQCFLALSSALDEYEALPPSHRVRELAIWKQNADALSAAHVLAAGSYEEQLRRISNLESQLAARPALEWIRGGDGTEHGGRELVVFEVEGRQGVTCARWDGDRDCWLDDETDGQNDRLEWYPGQVRWHIPTSALLDALPPAPKPPETG
jgi:hypothetical protein